MSAAEPANLAGLPAAAAAPPASEAAQAPGASPSRATRRGSSGVTTLEWLMVVGAVAGLAALAVVLVSRLVDDTAEGVSGVATNRSAAEAAALQITQEARDPDSAGRSFANWGEWSRYYTGRCTRLTVLYSSIELEVDAGFRPPHGIGTDVSLDKTALSNAEDGPPDNSSDPAQILCKVEDL